MSGNIITNTTYAWQDSKIDNQTPQTHAHEDQKVF